MNDDVVKFIKEKKQSRSILDDYYDDILYMRKANLSYKLIVEYLKTKEVKTTIQNVSSYYKRRTSKPKKTITVKIENNERSTNNVSTGVKPKEEEKRVSKKSDTPKHKSSISENKEDVVVGKKSQLEIMMEKSKGNEK